jgi:nitroreductase
LTCDGDALASWYLDSYTMPQAPPPYPPLMTQPSCTTAAIEQMLTHRSIRKYTNDPVPAADLHAAVAAGQAAATSSAVQAYSILRVTKPEQRAALESLTGPQEKVRVAPEFLVFSGDTRRHRLLAQRAGHSYDQSLEAFLVSVIDATLCAQNMVVALESMGYGTCYIGGLRNHLDQVIELLKLPTGVYPLFGLCIGRPAETPDRRPRLPPDAVLFDGHYPDDQSILHQTDAYDTIYRKYLADRGAPAQAVEQSWGGSMAAKFSSPARTDLARIYRQAGASLD